jgi:hypothetical protein
VRSNTRRRLPSFGVVAFVCSLTVGILLLGAGREVFAVDLNVLAAGATESILRDMVGTFEKKSGHTVKLIYAPVGTLRDKIFAGEPADLTLVTPVIADGEVLALVTWVELGRGRPLRRVSARMIRRDLWRRL